MSRGLLALLGAPILLAQPGFYSAGDLGYGSATHLAPFSMRYRLPPGTRAGHPFYVGVRLHGDLPVDVTRGDAEVTTTNNGDICASIRVHVQRWGRNAVVSWDGGPPDVSAAGTARRPVLRLRFQSICVLPSVRGGTSVARFAGRRLSVDAGSGVIVSRRLLVTPPGTGEVPDAAFAGVYPPDHVRAGRPFTIDVRLRSFRNGGRTELRVRVPHGPVAPAGVNAKRVVVRRASRTRASVSLHALRPGRSWVALTVGRVQTLVVIEVER